MPVTAVAYPDLISFANIVNLTLCYFRLLPNFLAVHPGQSAALCGQARVFVCYHTQALVLLPLSVVTLLLYPILFYSLEQERQPLTGLLFPLLCLGEYG